MNRVIKFRAIVPVNEDKPKEMRYYNISKVDDLNRLTYEDWDIGQLMQYTGLKDKNGVEIYEGDICTVLYTDWPSKSNDDPRTLDQYLNDIAKVGTIEYCQDGFYFVTDHRDEEKNYSHINPGTYGFVKVIGNCHQNPELLNKNQ